MANRRIEIVSATRFSEAEFWKSSALGQSLKRLEKDPRITASIAFENRRGLPEVYNERILAATSAEILVFVHDDVWIDDYCLADRLAEALDRFDIVGVAGNRRLTLEHVGWPYANDALVPDSEHNLSGRIAHGPDACGQVSWFGEAPAPCELLDGVFLAAYKATLIKHEVFFDPKFDFHFYDTDFCRSGRAKGLSIGSWLICLTHQSHGRFGAADWRARLADYHAKWNPEAEVAGILKRPAARPDARKVLYLGEAGKKALPAMFANWEVVHVAPHASETPDLVHDLRRLTETIPAASFDAVYCAYRLERYTPHEVPRLLQGFAHIVKADGFVEILARDVATLMRAVAAHGLDLGSVVFSSPRGVSTVHDLLYGHSTAADRDDADSGHKSAFSQTSLAALLERYFPVSVVLGAPERLELRALAFKAEPGAALLGELKVPTP
jgi:hypothetical protein